MQINSNKPSLSCGNLNLADKSAARHWTKECPSVRAVAKELGKSQGLSNGLAEAVVAEKAAP